MGRGAMNGAPQGYGGMSKMLGGPGAPPQTQPQPGGGIPGISVGPAPQAPSQAAPAQPPQAPPQFNAAVMPQQGGWENQRMQLGAGQPQPSPNAPPAQPPGPGGMLANALRGGPQAPRQPQMPRQAQLQRGAAPRYGGSMGGRRSGPMGGQRPRSAPTSSRRKAPRSKMGGNSRTQPGITYGMRRG